jgi:hypothetical protein
VGFSVQNIEFKIGDPGISQANDGSGNAELTYEVDVLAPFGGTIVNVANVTDASASLLPIAVQPDLNANRWVVSTTVDSPSAYPIATNTVVLTITAIVAD